VSFKERFQKIISGFKEEARIIGGLSLGLALAFYFFNSLLQKDFAKKDRSMGILEIDKDVIISERWYKKDKEKNPFNWEEELFDFSPDGNFVYKKKEESFQAVAGRSIASASGGAKDIQNKKAPLNKQGSPLIVSSDLPSSQSRKDKEELEDTREEEKELEKKEEQKISENVEKKEEKKKGFSSDQNKEILPPERVTTINEQDQSQDSSNSLPSIGGGVSVNSAVDNNVTAPSLPNSSGGVINIPAEFRPEQSSQLKPVVNFSKAAGTYSRKISIELSANLFGSDIFYCINNQNQCCDPDNKDLFTLYQSAIVVGPEEEDYCLTAFAVSTSGVKGVEAARRFVLNYSAPNLDIHILRSHYQTTNLLSVTPHNFLSNDRGNEDFLFSLIKYPGSTSSLSCLDLYNHNQTLGPYSLTGLSNLPMDDFQNDEWSIPYVKEDFQYGINYFVGWIYNPFFTEASEAIGCQQHAIVLEDFHMEQATSLYQDDLTSGNYFSLNGFGPSLGALQSWPELYFD
jgi:hypothetical protein